MLLLSGCNVLTNSADKAFSSDGDMGSFEAVSASTIEIMEDYSPGSAKSWSGQAEAAEEFKPEYSVFTDWSRLETNEEISEIYTRLSSGPLTEFTTSDSYGFLLPYLGEKQYTAEGSNAADYSQYGFITADGMIVTDPIFGSIYPVYYYTPELYSDEGRFLNYYAATGRFSEMPDKGSSMLVSSDGSFYREGFEEIVPCDAGAVGIIDREKNYAVCYAEDGTVVFDTREFEIIDNLDGLVIEFYNIREGYMTAHSDSAAFNIDFNGEILKSPDGDELYFESISPFFGGYAQIYLDNKVGYIDKNGYMAIAPQYKDGGSFNPKLGLCIVETDDEQCLVIDSTGSVISNLGQGIYPLEIFETDTGLYYVSSNKDKGENIYFNDKFQQISREKSNDKFLTRVHDGGITITVGGEEIFLAGAGSVQYCPYPGYFAVTLTDSYVSALMDKESKIVTMSLDNDWSFVTDIVTGEGCCLIGGSSERGGQIVFNTKGLQASGGVEIDNLATTRFWPPINGYFFCTDSRYSGWKNTDNEWIFRISLNKLLDADN